MDNKVADDFIRQLAKSIIETYGNDKTGQLIKELERQIRIRSSFDKATEQNDDALKRLND